LKKKVDQAPEAKKAEKALTAEEVKKFAECEKAIRENSKMYFLAGKSLTQISEERLYKAEFTDFDKYCEGRWGFSGSHARRLMEASELVKKLRSKIIGIDDNELPQNEFQARLFMELRDEEKHWVPSWKKLLKVVKDKNLPITAVLIRKVLDADKVEKSTPKRKERKTKDTGNGGVEKALALISEARAQAAEFSQENWTELLVELEALLLDA